MSARKSDVKFTVNAAFFQEIKEDHKQLKLVLDQLSELIGNRPALNNHPRKFSTLLGELRDQLAFHFTLEEAYGYFEDAIERAPRFHEQAGRLRAQHSELYVMCQELADKAAVVIQSGGHDVTGVADQFVAFHTALQAHESAELNLILDAINLDMGEGD